MQYKKQEKNQVLNISFKLLVLSVNLNDGLIIKDQKLWIKIFFNFNKKIVINFARLIYGECQLTMFTWKNRQLCFNWRAIINSESVTEEKNAIHCFTEVDITEPCQLMKDYFKRTGEKPSLAAYIVTCQAQDITDNSQLNSFIKGRRLIILDGVTINVGIERDIKDEKVPEPVGIKQVQLKSFFKYKTKSGKQKNNKATNWEAFPVKPGYG